MDGQLKTPYGMVYDLASDKFRLFIMIYSIASGMIYAIDTYLLVNIA